MIYHGVVVCDLGPMDCPDGAAEMADFLLRWEVARWIICMGLFGDAIVVAVPANNLDGDAGLAVQDVVEGLGTGGGHGLMALGRIPLDGKSTAAVVRRLRRRFLRRLGRAGQAREKLV